MLRHNSNATTPKDLRKFGVRNRILADLLRCILGSVYAEHNILTVSQSCLTMHVVDGKTAEYRLGDRKTAYDRSTISPAVFVNGNHHHCCPALTSDV